MTRFRGKVVLVTGAGRGVGRSIALAFAAEGARVAANDLTPINLDETERLAREKGGILRPYIADIAKKIPVQTMLEKAIGELGPIEVLVNCASVEPDADLLSLDDWDWERTMAVNLKGPFLTTQAVGRRMSDGDGGVILNVIGPSKGRLGQTVAGASRAGLLAFTLRAATELGAYNIRVHALCAAGAAVDCSDSASAPWPRSEATPSGGDLSGWALYLCSDQAIDLTGRVIQLED